MILCVHTVYKHVGLRRPEIVSARLRFRLLRIWRGLLALITSVQQDNLLNLPTTGDCHYKLLSFRSEGKSSVKYFRGLHEAEKTWSVCRPWTTGNANKDSVSIKPQHRNTKVSAQVQSWPGFEYSWCGWGARGIGVWRWGQCMKYGMLTC